MHEKELFLIMVIFISSFMISAILIHIRFTNLLALNDEMLGIIDRQQKQIEFQAKLNDLQLDFNYRISDCLEDLERKNLDRKKIREFLN